MKNLEKGLKEFAKLLKEAKKSRLLNGYVLIGGVAVSARSRPRATKDIDFLVDAEKSFFTETLPRLIKQMGYKFKIFKGGLLDPISGVVRIYDHDGSEFVDIIPVFWKWQDESIINAESIEIFNGISIPVARIEDLIVLKLKAGGAQDMLDVAQLLKASEAGKTLDEERLVSLAKKARVDKKLSKLLKS